MMRPHESVAVYLCCEPIDLRKSIDGLAAWTEQELALDPFGPALFVFCNRKRDKVKVLYWERSGFVLWYKRLEKERFPWPMPAAQPAVQVTGRELNWLLDGLDVFRVRPHETLAYRTVL